MKLREVMAGIEGLSFLGSQNVDVAGIRYDSRRVKPGDLFAAVRGQAHDGADFVLDAREKGAGSFLLEREIGGLKGSSIVVSDDIRRALALASKNFYGDPSSRLKVVGITGTNGKTTTAYLVHGILENAGVDAGLVGTVQYLVGGEVISASRTTPEAPDLAAMMTDMADSGSTACIIEVSSHALTLKRVTGVRMEVAVFTNLTADHLDFHEDMEDYFAAKISLFEESEVAHCLINYDDPFGRRLIEKVKSKTLLFGMEKGEIRPDGKVELEDWGSRCSLNTPWGKVDVDSPLPGLFNVSNIMAAVGVCGLLGLDADSISEGICQVHRVPGRFEKIDRGQPYMALVDYAHTPDALDNLLKNVRELVRGRVVLIFGCGGDRDKTKRPIMGEIAERLADIIFVTSDNPRTEDPEKIIDDIFNGLTVGNPAVRRVSDRREAIRLGVDKAESGDVLVLAGKGHENYQIVGERTLPFSDADELAEAIRKSGESEL